MIKSNFKIGLWIWKKVKENFKVEMLSGKKLNVTEKINTSKKNVSFRIIKINMMLSRKLMTSSRISQLRH